MSENMVTPKFLTTTMARQATWFAFRTLFDNGSPLKGFVEPKRQHLAIVVLVPGMRTRGKYPEGYQIEPVVMLIEHFGHENDWEHPYGEIALCKALKEWHGRAADGPSNLPHLLFPGDTPYWASVKRQGIVVAASGVEPWFDRLAAGMVADVLIALAHDAWEKSDDKKNGVAFLTTEPIENHREDPILGEFFGG